MQSVPCYNSGNNSSDDRRGAFWRAPDIPPAIFPTVQKAQLERALTHIPMIYAVALFNLGIAVALCVYEGLPPIYYSWMGALALLAFARMIMWMRRGRSGYADLDPPTVLRGLTIAAIGIISILSAWSVWSQLTGLLSNLGFLPISLVFGSTCIAHCLAPIKKAAIGALLLGVLPSAFTLMAIGDFEQFIMGTSMVTIAFLMIRFISATNYEIIHGLLMAEQIHRLAHSDELTGIANRRAVMQRLEDTERDYREDARSYAVALLDLNGFKRINDEHGHHIGDALLQTVADRLRAATIGDEMPGRLGGDEFVIILPGVESEDEAGVWATAIMASFAEPALIEQHRIPISGSIGYAVRALEGADADDLLRRADAAQYRMKNMHRRVHPDVAVRAA